MMADKKKSGKKSGARQRAMLGFLDAASTPPNGGPITPSVFGQAVRLGKAKKGGYRKR